jgi:mutator protein MutT
MFPNFALILLLNASHEILLLRRTNTPFCNQCYSLPGGAIKIGETARETVIRELRDSLGITAQVSDLTFKHIMYRKCNEPEFFACFFVMDINNAIPRNNQPDRHDDMQWFAVDALPDKMVPAHRYGLELINQGVPYSEHGWDKIVAI